MLWHNVNGVIRKGFPFLSIVFTEEVLRKVRLTTYFTGRIR